MIHGPPFGYYLINRFMPHECFIDIFYKMSGTGRNKSENITASKMIRFSAAFELKT